MHTILQGLEENQMFFTLFLQNMISPFMDHVTDCIATFLLFNTPIVKIDQTCQTLLSCLIRTIEGL